MPRKSGLKKGMNHDQQEGRREKTGLTYEVRINAWVLDLCTQRSLIIILHTFLGSTEVKHLPSFNTHILDFRFYPRSLVLRYWETSWYLAPKSSSLIRVFGYVFPFQFLMPGNWELFGPHQLSLLRGVRPKSRKRDELRLMRKKKDTF